VTGPLFCGVNKNILICGRIMVIMGRAVHLFTSAAFLFIVAFVWMAGCTDQPVKNITPEPGPAILVDYYRTGGIGGFDDHLVIFENGAAVYSGQRGRGAFIINQNVLDKIKDSFYTIGFVRMNASYPALSPGADYQTYTITYHNYTVKAEDTGVPLSLQPVIQDLNELISIKANSSIHS
jgi:hypothetical protein